MGLCHLKNSELELEYQKYKVRVVLSIPTDSRKSHGHFFKASRVFRTSSRCSIRLYSGQNGRCTSVTENSKVRMSRYLDTSAKAQMAKSWSSMEDPVVPLERNLHGHPSAGLLWTRRLEKLLLKNGWEKVPKWECLFVNREKTIPISVCGRYQTGRQNRKHRTDVEIAQ